jgi:hypothetical protein
VNRDFHTKTAYEMASELQQSLEALPVTSFPDLRAGTTYYYKPSYGSGDKALTVRRMLPSRKMADVSDYGTERIYRITPTQYHGSFRALSEELLPWLGVTHEQVVDEAVAKGLEVPARVRVHYPQKFVELPERFELKHLQDVLKPIWGRTLTAATADDAIQENHKQIKRLYKAMVRAVIVNPSTRQDYTAFIQNAIDDIDFYRWLRPHVDVGGVFYLNGEKP